MTGENDSDIKGCKHYTMRESDNMTKTQPRKLNEKELEAYYKFKNIPFARCELCKERDIKTLLKGDDKGLFRHLCYNCRERVNTGYTEDENKECNGDDNNE